MPGRTFRVFVSSTFSDLKAERNALAKWVFPRLRALCESRGYKFQAVDLRWGVRDEAGLDQQTVRICLDEIARCQRLSPRPNFIVLLGDRYGWCPPPSAIPADEMELLRPFIEREMAGQGQGQGEPGKLVFGDPAVPEDADPVARHGWYRRDDNAAPAEYVLQPRRGEWGAYEAWQPVELRLRQALAGAAERAGLGVAARRKYRASATELEIMKGAVEARDAREHVFAFFRSISNLDDVKAALSGEAAKLIDTRPLPDETWDEDAWDAQRRLKELLADRIGEANVWPYEVEWDGATGTLALSAALAELPATSEPPTADTALSDTKNLCEAVWQRLSRVIAAEMDALDSQSADPLEVEKRAHADFGEERRRVFVGRHEPLARIAAYLKSGWARPLVIHGPSGCGKSAVMAKAIAEARAAHSSAVVIERFIGASAGTSEIRPLLESVCQEIARAFGGDQTAIGDYPKLEAELPRRLALATAERPLIVFLDALDQLGDIDDGRSLVWLPRVLPTNVRFVVSTLDDSGYACYPALCIGADQPEFVLIDALTKDEGHEILSQWLEGSRSLTTGRKEEMGRSQERGQLDLLLGKFEEEGSPLYLRLAFEEGRLWHSYDGDAPAAALPETIAGMVQLLFRRLSRNSQHGGVVTADALAHLATALYGLSDEEMLDLLWRDPAVRAEVRGHQRKHHDLPEGMDALPPVIWSRLFFDLEPYLTERDVFGVRLFSFFHRQFLEVARAEYLTPEVSTQCHQRHAAMLQPQPFYFGDAGTIPNLRKMVELPWQLERAGMWSDVAQLFEDHTFAQAWVREGLWYWLFPILNDALSKSRVQGDYDAANRLSVLMLTITRFSELPFAVAGPRAPDVHLDRLLNSVDASIAAAESTWLKSHPKAHALANSAAELYNSGRRDEALALMRQALSLDPDNELANFNLGLDALDRGDRETAGMHLRAVVRINPQHRRGQDLLQSIEVSRTPQQYLKEALIVVNFRQDIDAGRALLAEGLKQYPDDAKLRQAAESLDRFAHGRGHPYAEGRSARALRQIASGQVGNREADVGQGDAIAQPIYGRGLSTEDVRVDVPHAHSAADADRATALNIAYQKELAAWKALPWRRRIRAKKPEPPRGI